MLYYINHDLLSETLQAKIVQQSGSHNFIEASQTSKIIKNLAISTIKLQLLLVILLLIIIR